MIGEFDLRDLLNSYGIDYKKVLKNNVNVISNGEYEEIKSVLSFLVKKNISSLPPLLRAIFFVLYHSAWTYFPPNSSIPDSILYEKVFLTS